MNSWNRFQCERRGQAPWTKERDFSNHSYIDIYGILIVLLINPCAGSSWCPLWDHQSCPAHCFSLQIASISSSRTCFGICWFCIRNEVFFSEYLFWEETSHWFWSSRKNLLEEETLMGIIFWYLSFSREKCWEECTPSWNDTSFLHDQRFGQFISPYSASWPSSPLNYCTVSMLGVRLTLCFWTKFRSDFEWSPGTCLLLPCYHPQSRTLGNPRAADCQSSIEQVGCCRRQR